jgi:Fe2+ transport system protein FeoA
MNLYDAPVNEELMVTEIVSGREAKRRLLSIGIRQSDVLVKLTSPPWGAILVKNISTGATKVAVGRNLAKKILVKNVT